MVSFDERPLSSGGTGDLDPSASDVGLTETLVPDFFLGIFLEDGGSLVPPLFWPPASFGDPGFEPVED